MIETREEIKVAQTEEVGKEVVRSQPILEMSGRQIQYSILTGWMWDLEDTS